MTKLKSKQKAKEQVERIVLKLAKYRSPDKLCQIAARLSQYIDSTYLRIK